MIKPPIIWLIIFDFIGLFSKYVGFDEIKWLCYFTEYVTHKFTTNATIYANELILTPFSPFNIKCKKLNLMWKTSGKTSGNEFLQIMLQYASPMLPYATSKMELFMAKNGNSWELLLTVVKELRLKFNNAPRFVPEKHR